MYTPKGELNDDLLKLVQDPEIIEAFGECKTPEGGYEIVKKKLPEITMEEFRNNMQIMYSYMEESQEGLLSDEDLDEVAGGKSDAGQISTALGIVATVGGGVAALMANLAFMS